MKWLEEPIGTKYRYFVEQLADGKRIYLERPGALNKGCDFVIFIEDLYVYKNGNNKPPSHKDLYADLKKKKKHLSLRIWQYLIDSIEAIHLIQHPSIQLKSERAVDSLAPMSAEQIRLLCKWFFIEQDLTYWSGQGRDMLWNRIKSL